MVDNQELELNLIETESKSLISVQKALEITNSETFKKLFEFWNSFDREKVVNEMIIDLKSNINSFWINPKYNSDLNKKFNMLLLSHSGVYGGGLEAFSINFKYKSNDFPIIETMDSRFEYLDNISSFEAFIIYPLYDFTMKIQEMEDDFDEEGDLMTMYELYESTAYVLAHKVVKEIAKENLLSSNFAIEYPFFITISEHDSGNPDKIIYIINQQK